MQPNGLSEDTKYKDIGGGLTTTLVDGVVPHWNVDVPGIWDGPFTIIEIGSYVSKYCAPKPGIYRLIGLDDEGKPAILNRMCERDQTGTLYIGREGKNFQVRSRLSKLVRSLREPRGRASGVEVYNDEHNAGHRLRAHRELSERFPISKLAITWCYSNESDVAERSLLRFYFVSFGDRPPLNFK